MDKTILEISRDRNKELETISLQIARVAQIPVLGMLVLASFAAILAPILALQWRSHPFPGFLVEQSLVVSDTSGNGWIGAAKGIHFPMQIIKINNFPMVTSEDYIRFFETATMDRMITIFTVEPDGETWVVNAVKVTQFPNQDLIKLFWLPYSTGLIYLVLGIWVYMLRGKSGAGRAFAFVAASAAIVNLLLFNIWTGHHGVLLWTFAIAQLGGAIIVLAFLLPNELPSLAGRIWVRVLAYGISLALALWGIYSTAVSSNPWAYIEPWRWSYYYTGIGLVVFLLSMVFRMRIETDVLARQQVRIILIGSLLAFTPIGFWLAIQAIYPFPYNTSYFSIFLLLFPISIAIAMVRFRLWDFQLVVRRTLIYTVLTILLVIIYLGLVVVLDRLFDRYLGDSNIFNVIATVVIVLIFTPLRRLVQRIIDRRLYRQRIRSEKRIQAFAERLRSQMELEQLSDDLIQVTQQTVHPSSISLWIPKLTNHNGGENG